MGIPGPERYQWVKSYDGHVPSNGVVAGYDNEEAIYVGRAVHMGAMIPGKIHPSHSCCYISYDGREYAYGQYEVLCSNFGGEPNWQKAFGNDLPPGVIEGGNTDDGEPLFVGRHEHGGGMVPGKVQKTHCCLYIPYGRSEHVYSEYEVLVAGSP